MALVTAADRCYARVLDSLDRRGLYDDTLIVFLSDHGELLGSRGLKAFSKYNLYERAVRVPLIVKPPKGLGASAGTVSDELVSIVDVLPTLLSICGVEGADALPGMDLAPLLRGGEPERRRRAAITEFYGKGARHLAVRNREWKYIRGPHGEELYHLAEDPHEFRNLAGEPEAAERIADLKTCLLEEEGLACVRRAVGRRRYPVREWHYLDE
jgi:arylsulfatase A-like enzyme